MMGKQADIDAGYSEFSGRYDAQLSTKRWWERLLSRFVWDFPSADAYVKPLLEMLPDGFSGKLLDIPVGTGLFTCGKYAKMKQADITCVDHSRDMMDLAVRRFGEAGIANAVCMQGDVGRLGFEDESFDAVLSMNGLHAFPDKEAAYAETARVLKSGGAFLGCLYVSGESRRTDWFIDRYYAPRSYFTAPFHDAATVRGILRKYYAGVRTWATGPMLCFSCVKG